MKFSFLSSSSSLMISYDVPSASCVAFAVCYEVVLTQCTFHNRFLLPNASLLPLPATSLPTVLCFCGLPLLRLHAIVSFSFYNCLLRPPFLLEFAGCYHLFSLKLPAVAIVSHCDCLPLPSSLIIAACCCHRLSSKLHAALIVSHQSCLLLPSPLTTTCCCCHRLLLKLPAASIASHYDLLLVRPPPLTYTLLLRLPRFTLLYGHDLFLYDSLLLQHFHTTSPFHSCCLHLYHGQ